MCQIQLGDLLKAYQPPDLPAEQVAELKQVVTKLASDASMEKLPALDDE